MKKNFTLIYLLLIFILGTALKGFTQTAGDFQTKGISGNWSDFNAWNIYNGSMWIAATSGQIPIATSSVFVQAGQTISVDNGSAVCNNLDLNTFGSNTSRVAFAIATSILNVKGNLIAFNTSPSCFGLWTAGAKIVFSGTGAQGFTNLSVNSVFVNIEVNKSSGTLTTSSNFRFGSFTLTAGNFTVGSTNQIQGTSTAATININGGVWNQVVSTTQIFSIPTASPLPIGALNINGGSMVLATTNGATGFMFSTISITNGGTFTLNNFTGNISISTSINIDATSTFNTALTTTALPPTVTFNGVVNYNFAGAQTISQATYSYLKLNGTGIKTLAAGTTTIPANGTLEMSGIATSPTLALVSGTLTVSNSATNLLYTSTGVQTASLTEWDPNFQNITVNNAAGVSMADLTRTILGSLNLTNGTFNIGANGALTLDGAPLNRTNGYITGTSTSDLIVTGTTGGSVLLPLPVSTNISLRNITIAGTRTLAMDGLNNINLFGAFTIASGATYDNGGESQIVNGGGGSINITGKFITRDIQGFYGSNTAIPGILPALNSGSTVEYGLLGDQTVQGGTLPPYYNVTFSGSGTKTLQSTNIPAGTITVSDSAIFDAQNFTFGGAGTNLTMTGTARYINGGGTTKPDTQGVYTLGPATTIEFALNSATAIRLGLSPIQYANIVVSGTNVSNASTVTGIAFQTGGSFIVTPGATFKLENASGFTGSTSAAISITNNPFILIQNGSTIEYSGTGDQLITNQFPYQNLSIAGSGNKTAPSSVLTLLGDLTKSGASTFLHNSGTVLLIGFGAESFAGLTYNNLILSNSTKTTSGNTTIIDSIKINDEASLSISAPDTITLHSDATKTARIGQIGTGTISYNTSGKFLVERYIPAKKAWRFLAVPVNSLQTIKQAWQEGALNTSSDPKPGYGTQITSNRTTWAADGFDVFSSGGPSMKAYQTAGNKYLGISSTLNLFDPPAGGYMTFIRGNRLANSFASPVSATVLRTAGTLFTGSQAPINVISGDIIPVNNPYASPLDLRQISQSNNVFYYAWDPNRGGIYGLGAFQTLSWNGTDYDVVPGGGSYGATNNFIASGQAFFASTLGADTSVQLTEVAKTPALFSVTPFTPVGVPPGKLRTNLYSVNTDGSSFLADGFLCSFGDNYSNAVNGTDAAKLSNFSENLSVKNNNVLLAVERRHYPWGSDTIFLNLTGTSQHQYRLETILSGLSQTGSDAYLEDNYLHTRFLINADDTTKMDFAVNGDVTSSAPDRFRIVFEAAQGTLPVTFTNEKAYLKNENIIVEWNVENETGIRYYQVQKSLDGTSFTPTVAVIAHNNQPSSSYNWLDVQPVAGYNYYRIKSIGINGEINYSKILQVFAGKRKNGITVYPNPASNGIIHLQFSNQSAGKYVIRLINKSGQVIVGKEIRRTDNGSSTEIIPLDTYTAHGVYRLEVTRPDGSQLNINMIY